MNKIKIFNVNICHCLFISTFFILSGCGDTESKTEHPPGLNDEDNTPLITGDSDTEGEIVSTSLSQREGTNATFEDGNNTPPIVNLGSDFEVNAGTNVSLIAEVSDTDGEIVSTSWSQLEGMKVTLDDDSSVKTTFIAPLVTFEDGVQTLVFELTATDNSNSVNTNSISIKVIPLNEAPVANAGNDQIKKPTSKITLDCGQSYDPEGDNLTVSWLQTSGSAVALDNSASCLTTFDLPNTEDVFDFSLTVTDTKGESSSDTVRITSTILPLLTLDNFEYEGGFRLSTAVYGASNNSMLSYSPGTIALSESKDSLFVISHTYEQGIGEFEIPEIVNSTDVNDFNVGSNVLQNFAAFYGNDRDVTGITAYFKINGMQLIDGKLVVNYFNWYDAAGSETDTTVVFQDPNNLDTSDIVGPFQLEGNAHASGWMTPIPEHWQDELNGTHVSGISTGSINGRLSIGPPAFLVNPEDDLINKTEGGEVPTTAVLDFNITNKLYDKNVYTYEESKLQGVFGNTYDGNNKIWTVASSAMYGFIVPNTNTYVTLGHTSGIDSGIGYKITQDNGRLCGGYCPFLSDDAYNYAWFWKVSDLVKVQNGELNAYDVQPYNYAKFDTIGSKSPLKGGAFDPETMTLYISLANGDRTHQYARPPLFLKYKINIE